MYTKAFLLCLIKVWEGIPFHLVYVFQFLHLLFLFLCSFFLYSFIFKLSVILYLSIVAYIQSGNFSISLEIFSALILNVTTERCNYYLLDLCLSFWSIVDLQYCASFNSAKYYIFSDFFHYKLLQVIEYSSLCYTVGSHRLLCISLCHICLCSFLPFLVFFFLVNIWLFG